MGNIEMEANLTEKQELMLQKLHDAELFSWGKLKAKLLLKKSQPAQDYMKNLNEIARSVVEDSKRHDSKCYDRVSAGDLWNSIESRIEQEERAEFFLGKRSPKSGEEDRSQQSFVQLFNPAFASALVAVAFFGGFYFKKLSAPERSLTAATTLSSGDSQPLDSASQFASDKIQLVTAGRKSARSELASSAPVVDWVRSAGRVHLIAGQQKNHKNIIWVKPPFNQSSKGLSSDSSNRAQKFTAINNALSQP